MTENANTSGSERRRSARVWLRRSAKLIIVKGMRGTSTIVCKVLNRSAGGALIKVEAGAASVPDDFYLTIDGQAEERIVCTVVRRGQKLLGVRFVSQPNYQVRTQTSYA